MSLLFAALVLAQIHTGVNVLVTRDGRPVEGAVVFVSGAENPYLRAVTDENGVARFLLAAGAYDFYGTHVHTWAGSRKATIVPALVQLVQIELDMEILTSPLSTNTGDPGGFEMMLPPNQNYAVVNVHYATDRKLSGLIDPAERFNNQREPEERLRLGVSEVSIPRDHRIGELESPSILRFEFRPDPEDHVVILKTTFLTADDFYADFGKNDAIVFIHGYANTFADAVRRAAQIKYDLAFDGPIVAYSWPSTGTYEGYTRDEANVDWTAPHLQTFLETLAQKMGTRSIHIIAHSMGNRVLGRTVERLASKAGAPTFNQIVLAAPDIDAAVFKRDIAPALTKLSKHVTLYASSNDKAMIGSKAVHGYARAGESGTGIVLADGIETIDVTDVDTSLLGHSYVADNRTILSDLFCAVRGLPQAIKRCGLIRQGRHWKFVRTLPETRTLARYQCDAATCTR